MDNTVETIRAALASDATEDARSAGVAACQAVLSTLSPSPATPSPAIADAMPQLLAMMGKIDLNQLLDVAIERLRTLNAAKPGSPMPEPPRGLAFSLVPIPPVVRKRGV